MGICGSEPKKHHQYNNNNMNQGGGQMGNAGQMYNQPPQRVNNPQPVIPSNGPNPQAETYIKSFQTINELGEASLKEQIQMNLTIRNAKMGVSYTVSIEDTSSNKKFGSTSPQQSNNGIIQFDLSFIIDYFFEKEQNMKFTIMANNSRFEIDINLGNIMGARGQTVARNINPNNENDEKLIISCSTIKNNNMYVNLILAAESNGNVPCFFLIKKLRKKGDINKELCNVYKSEVRHLNGRVQFNPIMLPAHFLCNGEFDQPVILECHNANDRSLIWSQETCVDSLLGGQRNFSANGYSIYIVNIELKKQYTFIDYLRGGMQLNLSIGIDFTGSNGTPSQSSSLHFINSNGMNSYEKAIRACGDVVAYYDYDQAFPVYGYGAVIGGGSANHCFNLNFDQNPEVVSIDGVLNCYRTSLNRLQLSGPTFFAPLISQFIQTVKFSQNNKMAYSILLILTDGMINDMDETVDALVEASFLPISVIIVGIGTADFSNMDVLDADQNGLIDRKSRKAARDVVQFVPFYKFSGDGKKLAEKVLEEIPRQVVEFYKLTNTPPGDPIVNLMV
jgi:hypothetical protein